MNFETKKISCDLPNVSTPGDVMHALGSTRIGVSYDPKYLYLPSCDPRRIREIHEINCLLSRARSEERFFVYKK